MSIWLSEKDRIIVQGMTGKSGQFHTKRCIEYGTNVVAGITPGKGGQMCLDCPILDTVQESIDVFDPTVSLIFVPPAYAKTALIESFESGISLIVCITEGIPVHDMLEIKNISRLYPNSRLIGPNCPGIITPGESKVGIMPGSIHKKGRIGIVSRSGTLTYLAVQATTKSGYGQSTCVGIGGDPLNGTTFIDVFEAFMDDDDTDSILMIGEIGGTAEEEVAEWLQDNGKKPVIAFIAGQHAPKGKQMGHAGAIIEGNMGTAQSKMNALRSAGVHVVPTFSGIVDTIRGACFV